MSKGLVLKINDRIRNRKVEFFNNWQLRLVHDSVGSTFSFSYYFNPNNSELKEMSCVTHFHEVTLEYNDELLVTGVITSQKFFQEAQNKLVTISGYSKPGVLEDCQIPPSIYPLQSNGLTLSQIADKLVNPFRKNYGLDFEIDPDVLSKMNKVYKVSTASATQSIKDYLSTICSQRNIILTHNEKGNLYFTTANTTGNPILEFDTTKETIPGTNFVLEYNGQMMHSHITIMGQSSIDGGNSREYTLRNPYVIGTVYRPKVIEQSSGDDNDTKEFARRELGNELSSLKLTITTDRWVIDGKIIKPNNIITVYAPDLYIYHKSNWFIQSIEFNSDSEKTIAKLNCVLPEVYNSDEIISIFREINLH